MHKTEVKELRLQVADTGDIWATSWLESHPRCVASGIEDLIASKLFLASTSVAIVAFPTNVKLITEIYLRKHKDADYSIWVASPLLVGATKPDRIDPVSVLEASHALDPHLSPSLGGWHQFGKADYPAYALAEIVSQNSSISDQAIQLLEAHPVWPALSFISGLNKKMCCRLLATVLDPRWYIDLKQPARTSRLESYLGLTLRVQRTALNMLTDVDPTNKNSREKIDKVLTGMTEYEARMVERCTAVQYCWWRDPAVLTCPDSGATPGQPLLEAPGGFLWRVWFSHGKSPKGYLRASQQFVRFLRDSWLDALYSKTVGDGLFIPDYFFKHNYEQLSFMQHMARFESDRG